MFITVNLMIFLFVEFHSNKSGAASFQTFVIWVTNGTGTETTEVKSTSTFKVCFRKFHLETWEAISLWHGRGR